MRRWLWSLVLGGCSSAASLTPPPAPAVSTLEAVAVAPGPYVAGSIDSGGFVPEGDVQGELIVADGTPGWLELLDGSFSARQDGRTPRRPYVEGVMSHEGLFSPSAPEVHY